MSEPYVSPLPARLRAAADLHPETGELMRDAATAIEIKDAAIDAFAAAAEALGERFRDRIAERRHPHGAAADAPVP